MSGPVHARAFTFDCYGTLIDWRAGVRSALARIGALRGLDLEAVHARRIAVEMAVEAEPYRPYDAVLAASLRRTAAEFGREVGEAEARRFAASIVEWPPFPDASPFLRRLRSLRRPLAILSNITRDALRSSVRALGVPFDALITAEDVRAYKPAPLHWAAAQARLGLPPGEMLHIAASVEHDVRPALALGVPTVWVNREAEPLSQGVSPALVVRDLAELAERLDLPRA